MAVKKRPSSLGRGLDALLGGDASATPEAEGELRTLEIAAIQPGKYQPRHHFDTEPLDELAASIKAQGLIQSIVVRAVGPGRYELIAGERPVAGPVESALAAVAAIPDMLELHARRGVAEAVSRALGLLGVPTAQMEAVSFGKEKPAMAGGSEDARAENRRVELSYR